MEPPTVASGSRRQTAVLAVLALGAYLAAALWAREISLEGPALIWFPPAAVAIAVCYFRPKLVWVVVVAELVSTPLVMGLGAEYGPLLLVVNSVGLALAYALGGWVLRRLALDPRLRDPEDLAVLALGIGAGATCATAIGVPVQWAAGLLDGGEMARAAALFWVGDLVGAACLLPALLIGGNDLAHHRALRLADDELALPRWQLGLELLAPSVIGLVLMEIGQQPMRFVYLAFLPVVIVAVRHGVAAAALSTAALSAVMTAGAHVQLADALDRSDFQLLMLVLVATGVTTGSVVSSRRDLSAAKARVSEIVEATPDLVASASRDGSIRYLNLVGRNLLGFSPDSSPASRAFDFFPDKLAQDLVREGMRTAERLGTWTGENRLRRPDGQEIPISQVLVAHPGLDEDGQRLYSTICRDMTSQRALEDQLRRAALYDDATGLPNRVLLVEQLARIVSAVDRDRRAAVLFADLDHLQRVNETFGFAAGDQVVTTIARRLSELIRAQDLIARHGGSQFVVVLADVPDEFEAILLADRLLSCFAEPVVADGHELKVTGSVGITLIESGQDHIEALRCAEIALHRAKEAGGGRYALFDDDLQLRSLTRLEREADLHDVLTKQAWTLAYQPIFDSQDRQVVGVEALLRWTHPTRGPVAPFELIRLAEHTGAIVTLGREIFRRACHEARQWHDMGFAVPVSINVSARQLREPSFLEDVESVLQETGIEPGCVVVELTETVLATREHGEIETLQELRSLGCRVALDDFGTGYSSLSELRDLPIDVVKLDQSFITDLTTSARAAALVGAVVRLSAALDLVVVAEGVERDDQIEALAALGCHRIQGYALSRPVDPAIITGMLRDARRWPSQA
ncbi:MAG: diguanylate cyclase/phosphodiesterase [Ilumatobacteraceae bacterium]|nr:diguanylate cyclase/phosphodiesterase [Ilumatobacteraceae bacterium]